MALTQRIQVWFEDDPQAEIPERELAAFSNLKKDNAESLLLTNELETEMEVGGKPVRCVPVVKYLLLGI